MADTMNRTEVLAAMQAAGLERPRIIIFHTHEKKLFFDLCSGPNDPTSRRTERVAVAGTKNVKASRADVDAAIARLSG